MASQKKEFLKSVIVLIDTREQKNQHIISELEKMGVRYEIRKLDFGDYSFCAEERDFSLSCVIERKANINELYGNISNSQHRERIEKEFFSAKCAGADMTLVIENCEGEKALKTYEVSEDKMIAQNRKVKTIGLSCYQTISSWQCNNRYGFRVAYIKDQKESAVKILEMFYYYWHNYKKTVAPSRGE